MKTINRKSFTMIEIVLVLVITGIIGVAGSMAIVQIMQNYAIQKEYAKLEIDSASAIKQISKCLQDSIWDSIAIKQNGNKYTSIYAINTMQSGEISQNNQLAFIEKDMDIINGGFAQNTNIPYFSGFIDLKNSNNTTIKSLSNTDKLKSIPDISTLALYFPYINVGGNVFDKYYTTENNRRALFSIKNIQSDTQMTLSSAPKIIADVAVITKKSPTLIEKDNDGNVNFINNNDRQTILQNVSSLSVWAESTTNLLRIRICFVNKTMDFMPTFCKEGIITQ